MRHDGHGTGSQSQLEALKKGKGMMHAREQEALSQQDALSRTMNMQQEASHNWRPAWNLKHAHLWEAGSQSELEAFMDVKHVHTGEREAQ